MHFVLRIFFVFLCIASGAAYAQPVSLWVGDTISAPRENLLIPTRLDPQSGQPHLFVGRSDRGMFAYRTIEEPAFETPRNTRLGGSDVQVIRALIQEAESRRDGYDAVQHGARIKPRKRPTQMTLAEIYAWIKATPGQPHAIGRYQFIPATLRRVVKKTGMKPSQRFSPAVQDQLADVLLADAGLHRFRKGALGRKAFMNNLARIWAGLPNSSGRSHYHGYAGNKASISLKRFNAVMARISPKRG